MLKFVWLIYSISVVKLSNFVVVGSFHASFVIGIELSQTWQGLDIIEIFEQDRIAFEKFSLADPVHEVA